jgi:hypothetical protein
LQRTAVHRDIQQAIEPCLNIRNDLCCTAQKQGALCVCPQGGLRAPQAPPSGPDPGPAQAADANPLQRLAGRGARSFQVVGGPAGPGRLENRLELAPGLRARAAAACAPQGRRRTSVAIDDVCLELLGLRCARGLGLGAWGSALGAGADVSASPRGLCAGRVRGRRPVVLSACRRPCSVRVTGRVV